MSRRTGVLRALLCALLAAGFAIAPVAPAAADVVDDNVAAVANQRGEVELFARGDDGAIYTRMADGGDWTSIGGAASSGPAAMVRGDGTLDVFVRGVNEELFQRSRRGGEWSDWISLGGQLTSAPAAVERKGTANIEVFVRGTDNALHHRWYQPGSGWSAWSSMGGSIASAPAIVSRKEGWADVLVRWSDNRIWQKYFDPAVGWSDWFETPRVWATLSAPSATVPGEGRVEAFHRGTNNFLYQRSYTGTSWGEGDYLVDRQPLQGTPTAVADPSGRLRLYTRFNRDILVKTLSGGGWSQWTGMGPVAPAPPPPAPPAPAPPAGAPVNGGQVQLGAGLGCTPRGARLRVSVKVRKRKGRAKPRVKKVVFYYRKGRGSVARADRKAPYARRLPVSLPAGTHRVRARIYYKRPGKRKLAIKTVSRRFEVCA